jgi:hypothetical protein
MQDCLYLVAPFPFWTEPLEKFNVTRDFDVSGGGEVWYARQQLFLKLKLGLPS